jgi:hypothetical protein
MNTGFNHNGGHVRYQSGMVTTFTGVMILVLLTLMMFFAIRVGVFEQRVSSNEMRQKLAFHAAESGIHHAKELFRNNSVLIASHQVDLLPDGRDGWLASSSERRWQSCFEWANSNGVNLETDSGTHPCFGESNRAERESTYFYEVGGTTEVMLNTEDILPGNTEEVTVEALLCVLDVLDGEETPVRGCYMDPDNAPNKTTADVAEGIADGTYFMVTLLARGEADCDGTTCNAEALISEQVSNFGASAGGRSPAVPLTTKSSFPPSGTAEVVPNPNSGGTGVPISVWMNGNPGCSADGSVIDPSSGSWATCEMHEWYGIDVMPDNFACPGTCSCTTNESISNTMGSTDTLGIDLVQDEEFPCDLFQFYFGVPRSSYEIVKGYSKIINNCDGLGPNSFGIIWVTGTECRINANTQVGSPEAPVMLISAASLTRLNGGANIYGTLFVTDVEDANATLDSLGTNTVYGSVIVDGTLGSYQGTFQVVWNENTSRKAGLGGGLGSVIGGWSDFHADWQ